MMILERNVLLNSVKILIQSNEFTAIRNKKKGHAFFRVHFFYTSLQNIATLMYACVIVSPHGDTTVRCRILCLIVVVMIDESIVMIIIIIKKKKNYLCV